MKEVFTQKLAENFRQNLNGITPLQKSILEKAWERFCALGLPTKAMAGYQYFPHSQLHHDHYDLTTLPKISKKLLATYILPECRRSYVVIANGRFAPEYSDVTALPENVLVMKLSEALNKHGQYLQLRFAKDVKDETDPLAFLNIALIQAGLFIYIPASVTIPNPIQCIYVNIHEKPAIFSLRIHLFLGKGAVAKWIDDYAHLQGNDFLSNGVLDVALEEGAHFEHYGIHREGGQGFCFEALRATLKRDSTFKSLSFTGAARTLRQDYRVSLQGENASANLKGIALLTQNHQSHINVLMNHEFPHTTSNQLFKNVLEGTSRSSFEGKIYVHSKAQKTAAYQLNKNLLLNEGTIANSKPNLEIFADDVKASHGATVTKLKQEDLFYLTSRGIEKETARKLLLLGFCKEILQEVPLDSLRQEMLNMAEKCIP